MTSNYSTILVDSGTNQLRYIAPVHQFQNWNFNQLLKNTPLSSLMAQSNACNVMTIMNNNIGIGTTIPLTSLHIINKSASNAIIVDGNNLNNAGLQVTYSLSNNYGLSIVNVLNPGTASSVSLKKDSVIQNINGRLILQYGSNLPGLIIDTNNSIGIGTTTTSNTFSVIGNVSIGSYATSYGIVAPQNGLIVSGNVGIATTNAINTLTVNGLASFSNISVGTYSNIVPPLNSVIISGNLGIGTIFPNSKLAVGGGVAIGNYSNLTAPLNSVIVSGNIGIGTTLTPSALNVVGGISIGTYANTNTSSITNGIIVSGGVGIGTANITSGNNTLNVYGNAAFGSSTTNLISATAIGVVVISTNTTIGGSYVSSTANKLDVYGTVGIGTTFAGQKTLSDNSPDGLIIAGNVGIGTNQGNNNLNVNNNAIIGSAGVTTGSYFVPPNSLYVLGNVGIGTNSITNVLEIRNQTSGTRITSDASPILTLNAFSSTNTANQILFDSSIVASTFKANVGIGTTGRGAFWNVNSVDCINIKYTDGNIGIGSSTPVYGLDINKATRINNNLDVTNGGIGIGTGYTGATAGVGNIIIGGKIGINTTSPSYNLHVAGNGFFDGMLMTSNLMVLGSMGIVKAYIQESSNVVIDNQSGIGPALTVRQKTLNGNGIIADFYDTDVSVTQPSLRICDGGNIGIGTGIGLQKLHLSSQSTSVQSGILLENVSESTAGSDPIQFIRFRDNNAGVVTSSFGIGAVFNTNKKLIITSIGSDTNPLLTNARITVQQDGNVGIGITTPKNIFDINGGIAIGTYAGTNTTTTGNMILSGNIGIGTTNPLYKLDVNGGGRFIGNVGIGTTQIVNMLDVAGSIGVGAYAGQNLSPNGNNGICISGNLGVGSAQPAYKVDIIGVSRLQYDTINVPGVNELIFDSTSINSSLKSSIGIGTTDTGVGARGSYWRVNNVDRININTIGNVGLGTTNPQSTLDVRGNIAAKGALSVGTPIGYLAGLNVNSNAYIGAYQAGAFVSPNSLIVSGNIGVGAGLTNNLNTLDVLGGVVIGINAGFNTAPTNGLAVSGNVGIGSTLSITSKNTLDIGGSVAIGNYAGVNTTTMGNIITSGNIGLGTTQPGTYKFYSYGGQTRMDFNNSKTLTLYNYSSTNNANEMYFDSTIINTNCKSSIGIGSDAGVTNDGTNVSVTTKRGAYWNVNGIDCINIDPLSGNVGIGSTCPGINPISGASTKCFDVNGDIRISGKFIGNGGGLSGITGSSGLAQIIGLPAGAIGSVNVIPTLQVNSVGLVTSLTSTNNPWQYNNTNALITTNSISINDATAPGSYSPTYTLNVNGTGYFNNIVYANGSGNNKLVVGTTSPTTTYALHVVGDIYATNDIMALSDRRVKTDIKKIENALEKIDKINGYTFKRIDTNIIQAGVIAQEIEEVLPEVVHTDNDGNKSVAYANIIALLIEGIKEQKEVINKMQIQLDKFIKQ
jgi:hypothetical protein